MQGIKVEPPPPVKPTGTAGRRDPKHMTTGQLEEWLKEIEEHRVATKASLDRTEARIKRWDKGN